MKINGKVLSKDEYAALEAEIIPMNNKDKAKLKKTEYNALGQEINNSKPVFINDPDELAKPITINGKIVRILRMRQMQAMEESLLETEDEMNDFGPEEQQEFNTEFQVIDLEDPDFPNTEEDQESSSAAPTEEVDDPQPAGSEESDALSSDSAGTTK